MPCTRQFRSQLKLINIDGTRFELLAYDGLRNGGVGEPRAANRVSGGYVRACKEESPPISGSNRGERRSSSEDLRAYFKRRKWDNMGKRYQVYGGNTSRADPTPVEDSSYNDYTDCIRRSDFRRIKYTGNIQRCIFVG